MKENKGIINSINLNSVENLSLTELEERFEFSIIPIEAPIDTCDKICDRICDKICDQICDGVFSEM